MEVTTFMALFYLFSLGAILVMRKVAPENMCWYPFYIFYRNNYVYRHRVSRSGEYVLVSVLHGGDRHNYYGSCVFARNTGVIFSITLVAFS